MRQRIPTFITAGATAWYGIDFAFLRDLSGEFTYYGSIPQNVMDNAFGLIALSASIILACGAFCRDERIERVGYVLASLSYGIFAIGMLANGIIVHSNAVTDEWFSSLTPGVTYLLLSAWMLLTSTGSWDRED